MIGNMRIPLASVVITLAGLTTALPIPNAAVSKIERATAAHPFLPTTLPRGFSYSGWNFHGRILRVHFQRKTDTSLWWAVAPQSGNCATGSQKTLRLDGYAVFWGWNGQAQFAWRCAFDGAGKAIRLVAETNARPNRLIPSTLGMVVARAKRH
jgi:hypothetical protein